MLFLELSLLLCRSVFGSESTGRWHLALCVTTCREGSPCPRIPNEPKGEGPTSCPRWFLPSQYRVRRLPTLLPSRVGQDLTTNTSPYWLLDLFPPNTTSPSLYSALLTNFFDLFNSVSSFLGPLFVVHHYYWQKSSFSARESSFSLTKGNTPESTTIGVILKVNGRFSSLHWTEK